MGAWGIAVTFALSSLLSRTAQLPLLSSAFRTSFFFQPQLLNFSSCCCTALATPGRGLRAVPVVPLRWVRGVGDCFLDVDLVHHFVLSAAVLHRSRLHLWVTNFAMRVRASSTSVPQVHSTNVTLSSWDAFVFLKRLPRCGQIRCFVRICASFQHLVLVTPSSSQCRSSMKVCTPFPTRSVVFSQFLSARPQWSHMCARICILRFGRLCALAAKATLSSCMRVTLSVLSFLLCFFCQSASSSVSRSVASTCWGHLVGKVNAIGGARLPLAPRVQIVLFVSCVCQIAPIFNKSSSSDSCI